MIITKQELRASIREILQEFFADQVTPKTTNDFIDVVQAAALLNLARATVYEKTSLRQLPYYKKGKKIMFKRSELLEWMESGRVESGTNDRQRAIRYIQAQDRKR